MRHRGVVLQRGEATPPAQVSNRQPQRWMSLGDARDLGKRVRCEHVNRDTGFLGLCPKPVDGAIGEPPSGGIVQEVVAQAEYARLLPPAHDACARARLVQWQPSHDRKPARVVPHCFER